MGRLAERSVESRALRPSPYLDANQMLKFATCVTSRNGEHSMSDDKTIIKYINNIDVPSSFSLQYYNSSSDTKPQTTQKQQHTHSKAESSTLHATSSKSSLDGSTGKSRKNASASSLKGKAHSSKNMIKHEGLSEYIISTKDAINQPLDKIISDAFKVVPKRYWLEVVIKAQLAKSTANTEEGARLRSLMLKMQCHALNISCTLLLSDISFSNKIICENANLIKQLSEILVPENNFSLCIRNATIDAFCALCCQPSAVPEIMVNLSSNVSHGTLMHVMRGILKGIRNDEPMDEEYFLFVDGMISLALQLSPSFIQMNSIGTTPGGMVPLFWELAKEEKATPRVRTNSMDGLIRIVAEVPGYLNTFLQQEDGCQELIKILQKSVETALNPALAGSPPTLCSVDYNIGYHYIQWLKVQLHFIVSITTHARTAERIQQILDSQFLIYTQKIIQNPKIFGSRVISITLGIIGNLLEHESSTFGIMSENHSIDVFLDEIPNLLSFSPALHGSVAKFLSSMAHNETCLELIKNRNIFGVYFDIVSNNLGEKENLKHLGSCLDQICTEHSALRPIVITQVIKLLNIIVAKLNTFVMPDQYFRELESTKESTEDDIGLAKRYQFLVSAVSFLECVLKNHFSRVEFINQKGVDLIIDILESQALSYDFTFNFPSTSVYKTLKQLFDLDIDRDYISNTILSRLSLAVDRIEANASKITSLDGDVIEENEFTDFLKSIGPFQNILYCFMFTVFTNFGTGYRIAPILEALSGIKNENDTDDMEELPEFYKDLIYRIGKVHQHLIWRYSHVLKLIPKDVNDATRPISYNPILNMYFTKYQDSDEFKRLKELEGKLPEDLTTSRRYRIIKCSRFVIGACNNMITEFFVLVSSFVFRDFSAVTLNKSAAKILHMISEIYYENVSLFLSRLDYPEISVWYVGTCLHSLFNTLSQNTQYGDNLNSIFFFKQQGGILLVSKIAKVLFEDERSNDGENPACVVLNEILSTFHLLVSKCSGRDTPRYIQRLATEDMFASINFKQFCFELRLTACQAGIELWNSDKLETKPASTINVVMFLLNLLVTPKSLTELSAPVGNNYIDWRDVKPSETLKSVLTDSLEIEDEDILAEILDTERQTLEGAARTISLETDISLAKAKEALSAAKPFEAPRPTFSCDSDGNPMQTLAQVLQLRAEVSHSALDKIVNFVRINNEIVFSACYLLFGFIPSSKHPAPSEEGIELDNNAINELLMIIMSVDPESEEDEEALSGFCQMLSYLLTDSTVMYSNLPDILGFVDFFVSMIETPNAANKSWFINVLLILEHIFTVKDIPELVEVGKSVPKAITHFTDPIPTTDDLDPEIYDRVFNVISNIREYKDEHVTVSVVRLLIFFTRNHQRAAELAKTDCIVSLLHQVKLYSKPIAKENENELSEKDKKKHAKTKELVEQLRTSVAILLRTVVETRDIVKGIILSSIRQSFAARGDHKNFVRFLESNRSLIARSPKLFIEVLEEECLLDNSSGSPNLHFLHITHKSQPEKVIERFKTLIAEGDELEERLKKEALANKDGAESDVSMEDVSSAAKPEASEEQVEASKIEKAPLKPVPSGVTPGSGSKSISLENPSGVISILLDELFAIGLDKLFTVPTKTSEALQVWVKENQKTGQKSKDTKKGSDNQFFHYACFLLQSISELISSYSICKLEFLNYSRKPSSSPSSSNSEKSSVPFKPRHAALNFFLLELVPVGVLESSTSLPYYEWNHISQFANMCIMTLLTATEEKYSLDVDETQNDPTLVFVRKFTIDSIIKCMREANHPSNESLVWRYAKVYALGDLCYRLFSTGPPSLSNNYYSPHSVSFNNGAAIAKVAYDKNLAAVFTAALSEIDLNYPFCRKPIKILVKCLNKLSRLTMEVSDDGTHEKPDDDINLDIFADVASDSGSEEEVTDNIFRNSALAMYEAGDELSSDEEDPPAEIEEEVMEEINYHDDEALSDVASDVDPEGDHATYDEDMDSEDVSQIGSSDDESLSDVDDDDVEIIDDEDVELIDNDDEDLEAEDYGNDHYSDYSGGEDSIVVADDDDEPDLINQAILPTPIGDESNLNTRNGELDLLHGVEEESDWESYEENDDEADEHAMEFAETVFQQSDRRGLGGEFGHSHDIDTDDDFTRVIMNADSIYEFENQMADHSFDLPTGGGARQIAPPFPAFSHISAMRFLSRGNVSRPFQDALREFLGTDRPQQLSDNRGLVVRARKTLYRWEDMILLFRIFEKVEVFYRIMKIFYVAKNAESDKVYKEIADLETTLTEKNNEMKKRMARKEAEARERLEREKAEKEAERIAKEEKENEERAQQETNADNESENIEMEDVNADSENAAESSAQEPARESYMMTISGHEIDVSGLGIDPSFLEAIPEELREEAFTQHLRELQRNASHGDTQTEELVSTFLNALPSNVRRELANEDAEGSEDENEGNDAEIADPTSFFASLDPSLRHSLLRETDDSLPIMDQALSADARNNRGSNGFVPRSDMTPFRLPISLLRGVSRNPYMRTEHNVFQNDASNGKPPKKKEVSAASLHIIDKQGIAALLRTLYLPQSVPSDTLYQLLFTLCSENKSNRLDIINTILHILMDASVDKATLDRGFIQTSNRARYSQNKALPTGSSARVPTGHNVLAGEITPSVVAKQALEALVFISHKSAHVHYFFLSEHDNPFARRVIKHKSKNKAKGREMIKESKYPINALINLLGRPSIYENSVTLENLAVVLAEITKVVPVIFKSLNKEDTEKPADSTTEQKAPESSASPTENADASNEAAPNEASSKAKEKATPAHKQHSPPYIPTKNYKLICKTLFLKECSSRTFEHMLNVIRSLSTVEGVKDLFAKELISQAISFGPEIIANLQTLNSAIKAAKPGDEVSSTALAPFSSGSSHQARLLRALAALDYLYHPSKDKSTNSLKDKPESADDDYLNKIYAKLDFNPLWVALSESLTLVQQTPALLYVATALLPLVESLMVMCKHSSVKKISLREGNKSSNDLSESSSKAKSHEPNNSLEALFFSFTDQHRKILNQLVRTNSKLMNGSFSILVKNPKTLEFDNKRKYFTKRLYGNGSPHTTQLGLNISRDSAFLDSFRALHFKTAEEIKQGRLNVKFKGEHGVDAGGLTREWYQVMSRQMFNPDYALFVPVTSDCTTFHPNRTSGINDNHLFYFKFIGRIIGKAIYDNKLLDCHFSRAMYKKILGKPVNLRDMENLDPDYYKSLQWMLENDITDIITETFSVESDDYGAIKVVDLKPDGRNIAVTEENKAEYVRLVCEYRLINSVRDQLNNFLEGFHDIIPKDIVSIFDEQELELLISGLPDIDIEDWRSNTEYQNYSPSSPQIKWFWRAVRSMDPEERAKLLQFVTGTSKVPLNGFKELVGMNGVSKFSIHREFSSQDRLPTSHTCFNQLDLPVYPSYEILRKLLLKAISEGGGSFDLA